MSRKGKNIYERKDGRWEGRYIKERNENAKIHYGYVYGKSYTEVKIKMSDAINAINTKCEIEKYKETEGVKFGIIAEGWFLEKKIFFKESTIARYENHLKLYLIPEFGDYIPAEISYEKIREFVKKLMQNGGCRKNGLSAKTVSDIMSLFYNIIRYANERGFCVPSFHIHISVQKQQIRVFSLEEQKKLCKYLKNEKNHTSLGILLCLFTGLRIGEICALKWEDISLENKTIYVHQTMQRLQVSEQKDRKTKILISAPKSLSSVRLIPIPNEMIHILTYEEALPKAFLLTGTGSKFIEPRTLQYRFKKILQKCQIENANFHVLRHTFATRCIEVGFDLKSLSEILGHANVNITLNRYVHPSMDLKRNHMEKLSDLLTV